MKKIFILAFITLANLTFAQQKLEFTLSSYPDVTVQYIGEVKDGKANGYGEADTFFKGNPDGTYKGNWKDNYYYGQGIRTWLNGDVYDGGFLNGKFHGKGTLSFGINSQWKGEKFVGDFINGQRTGKGTYTWANGDTYTGSWVNGFRSGYGKNTYTNGKIEDGQWENNVFKGGANTAIANNKINGNTVGNALTNPAFVGAMDNGDKYAGNNQYDLAIQEYTKALQILPNFSVALYQRGYVYQEKGMHLEDEMQFKEADKLYHLAINDYSEAIKSDPKDIEAYWARGSVYGFVGEYQKAVDDFTKMIELSNGDKKYNIAYKLRAMAYQELGQTQQAETDMEKYKELG